jgi:ubiquinone/menaquinone biosynthesis C-methylase UbiE
MPLAQTHRESPRSHSDTESEAIMATQTAARPLPVDGTTPTVDLAALKNRQHAAWSSGNYAVVGTTLQIVGEELCEALDLHAGRKVLDVAAGNGAATLAAARRWCDVVSTDYVPGLLERGQARASAEGLHVEFKEADAEALPFADGSFDTVISTFGVMFTPNQEKAAAELLRVCRSSGRIGLANWTPEGFIGQLFKTLGKYLPPPAGAKSPMLWGTRARLEELFGRAAAAIRAEPRHFNFRYRSAQHFLDVFKTYYGPMLKAFEALDAGKQSGLKDDLHALIGRMNKAGDGTMVVPSEYLEIVITKR